VRASHHATFIESVRDHRTDPDEVVNLAGNPAYAEILAQQQRLLPPHRRGADGETSDHEARMIHQPSRTLASPVRGCAAEREQNGSEHIGGRAKRANETNIHTPHRPASAQVTPEQRARAFERWDTNKDGVLTLDECRAGLKGQNSLEVCFKHVDKNNDRELTREEFINSSVK